MPYVQKGRTPSLEGRASSLEEAHSYPIWACHVSVLVLEGNTRVLLQERTPVLVCKQHIHVTHLSVVCRAAVYGRDTPPPDEGGARHRRRIDPKVARRWAVGGRRALLPCRPFNPPPAVPSRPF